MIDKSLQRKEAYEYIISKLNNLPSDVNDKDGFQIISLEDLWLLKEGVADPSEALVSVIKQFLGRSVNKVELYNYLVNPFKE